MQLAPPDAGAPRADDVATVLASARDRLGHRPAITVISSRGREEQGVASLAQWAAKGAHLLELDLLLTEGDRLRLDAPPSWPAAAVCLAAWWAGVSVTVGGGEADAAVVHERHPAEDIPGELFRLGDAADGTPLGDVAGEAWAVAVQAFPDQPPRPRARGTAPALESDGRVHDQTTLLARADDLGAGTLGIVAGDDGEPIEVDGVTALVAVTLRPLVTGSPTVVVQGVDRRRAEGERVRHWR